MVVGLIVAVALAITLLAANNNITGRATSHVLREPLTPAALAYRADTAHLGNPVTSAHQSAEAGARLDHRGLGSAAANPVAVGSAELSSGMGHR